MSLLPYMAAVLPGAVVVVLEEVRPEWAAVIRQCLDVQLIVDLLRVSALVFPPAAGLL